MTLGRWRRGGPPPRSEAWCAGGQAGWPQPLGPTAAPSRARLPQRRGRNLAPLLVGPPSPVVPLVGHEGQLHVPLHLVPVGRLLGRPAAAALGLVAALAPGRGGGAGGERGGGRAQNRWVGAQAGPARTPAPRPLRPPRPRSPRALKRPAPPPLRAAPHASRRHESWLLSSGICTRSSGLSCSLGASMMYRRFSACLRVWGVGGG
jgi:hypothetical protein